MIALGCLVEQIGSLQVHSNPLVPLGMVVPNRKVVPDVSNSFLVGQKSTENDCGLLGAASRYND